jgi:hypothetical protein
VLEIPKKHSLTILLFFISHGRLSILRCGDNDEENNQSLFFRLGQGPTHHEMTQMGGYDEYDVKLVYKLDNDQLDAKNSLAIVIHNRRL